MTRSTDHDTRAPQAYRADHGVAFGSAFLGWLTATGAAFLLTALLAGIGAAIGLGAAETAEDAVEGAIDEASTIGIVGAIVLAAALFIAYVAGGYVAGRMARVRGALQGLVVWLWALIFAVVVATLGAVGAQLDALPQQESFPVLPLTAGELTATGVIAAVIVVLVTLGGAVVGGMAGASHRHGDDPKIAD